MDIKTIEHLIQKSSLTSGEKKAIREAADAAGLAYAVRKGCRNCYERLLLRLYEMADSENLNTSPDGWRFKNPHRSFQHNGIIYNNETIKWLSVGHLHPVILQANFARADKGKEDVK